MSIIRSIIGGSTTVAPTAVSTSGTTQTLQFSAVRETSFQVTLNASCAISIGNAASGQDQLMSLDLIQGGSGGFTPNFPNVSWPGGISPAFNTSASKRDTIQVRGIGGDISGYAVSMGRVPMIAAAPLAPASITVTPGITQNNVTVAAVTAYPAVSGYTVYRGASSGAESTTPIAANVSLPYADTGLTSGTTYFYKVAAVNSVGTGPQSSEGSGVPLASGSAPGAPTSASASPLDGMIVVTAAAVSASPAVTGYTVYRGTAAGAESATPLATNVSLPYTDTGLTNGTTYYYKVSAVNSVGTGPQSPEASTAPVASAVHYATFNGDLNGAIYSAPQSTFNPGSNAFDMRAHVRMALWATGGSYETNLFGCWDGVTPANRLWRLGVTTDGRIRASWATASTVFPTATSSAAIGATGNTDLWVRAVVTPTTGAVAFYTSVNGTTWAALGTGQTASSSGAVYTPGTAPYLVVGQNASGASATALEEFTGRFIEAQFLVAGTLVTDPVMGPSSTTDSRGFTYGTSGSGVTYT